jgi:diguanylate cyclase (GGDEF)-like protein
MMKQRGKAGLKRPHHSGPHGLCAIERAELHRQGAKAAARGEPSGANPMDSAANLPQATGESAGVWQLRRDAWHSAHRLQSRPANERRARKGDEASVVHDARRGRDGERADKPSRHRLVGLRREISDAQDTLAGLQIAIATALSDKGLQALSDVAQENERLSAALDEVNRRAESEADTAHAALQDAVRASETDPLTRLPNRTVLWDRLAHDLALATRHGTPLAVFFLDLDGFKRINDRLGHGAGDQLLQHVAGVLLRTMRASDTVCRFGGDEFVIVANDTPRDELPGLAHKISEAVSAPCELAGETTYPRLSIGFSSFPKDATEAKGLVRLADAAMYDAKRRRSERHDLDVAGLGAAEVGATHGRRT